MNLTSAELGSGSAELLSGSAELGSAPAELQILGKFIKILSNPPDPRPEPAQKLARACSKARSDSAPKTLENHEKSPGNVDWRYEMQSNGCKPLQNIILHQFEVVPLTSLPPLHT